MKILFCLGFRRDKKDCNTERDHFLEDKITSLLLNIEVPLFPTLCPKIKSTEKSMLFILSLYFFPLNPGQVL